MIPFLIDATLVILVVWFMVTQVVIPIFRGSGLFPTFSKRRHTIADEVAEVEQELAAETLRRKLIEERKQLAIQKESNDKLQLVDDDQSTEDY